MLVLFMISEISSTNLFKFYLNFIWRVYLISLLVWISILNNLLKSVLELIDTEPNISFNLNLRKKLHNFVATH